MTNSVEQYDEHVDVNSSTNPTFDSVLDVRLSRRALLRGSAGMFAGTFLGFALSACGDDSYTPAVVPAQKLTLNFAPVAKSIADTLTVPAGYTATVLFRLGDPMSASTLDYRNDGTDDPASFAQRCGDHNDGMHYFGLGAGGWLPSASDRGLLVQNHEAISPLFLHAKGPTIVNNIRTVSAEVVKELNAHGVSIIEIAKTGNSVTYVRNSTYNRRITTMTDMVLSGPASGTPATVTAYSTDGTRTRGTVNNCANGYTPWGTYLTCEENWAGYFRRTVAADNPNRTAKELTAFNRYGVAGTGRELWATATAAPGDTTFSRWNAEKLGASDDGRDDFRNVANTYGWVVEVDPFAPTSTPRKRTALGRFGHEGAWLGPVTAGKPLVWYMGDDSRNEYIYKYVSNAAWDPADAGHGTAAGDKYLDNGRLYVAKFNADGTGAWVLLAFGSNGITATNSAYPFKDEADVLINARLAADTAGATKMDRPEWAAVNPRNGEVYITLTNNNTSRPIAATDAANPRFYNDVTTGGTAQRGNPNGHIIRLAEDRADPSATSFKWDIFLFGARATADPANVNVSALTAGNDFSSPDGCWFSSSGLLWIETDDGAYTDVTNCMLLAAVAGTVGDGAKKSITNTDGAATKTVDTYVGASLGEERLRRFLVGPKDCEITGLAETPDRKALFVNIQHPGETTTAANFAAGSYLSNWPDGGTARPRSATVVITRNDGGEIGGGLT
jgi:uncharacterized protein